jgi:N-acetylglucosaminyl-diphospho-decaprenol L-rhamnosyltransferase
MISLLVVNYRSARLAADAVRTARSASSAPLQVVIVDNSCDPKEAEALQEVADELLVSKTNRGYAGAINDGRRACTGDRIVISNPDVLFAPQAIDLLAGALEAKTAVAGPALFWDDGHRWHLPPGDLLTAWEKIDQVLASRSKSWRELRDERRFRKRVAFWSLTETTRVTMLSGAVMAVRADVFDALGGFDERFPLYFEETDFLRRVTGHRRHIVHVPQAKVRHIYNQSAAQAGDAAESRYAESEWKYLEKWCGPWLARTLKGLERGGAADTSSAGTAEAGNTASIPASRAVTEASPLATFETAAGHFGFAGDVPAEVRASLGGSLLYLRYKISP